MGNQIYDAAFYRKQPDEARRSAGQVSTPERHEGYLKLAADWDRLADAAEGTTAWDSVGALIHSTQKS
jgi:hypothetical protein